MQITFLRVVLSLLLISNCDYSDLYIIVDLEDKVNQVYPEVYTLRDTVYHACFLSRKVRLWSPYCFSTDQKRSELVNELKEIQGEIWNQDRLDDFLVEALLKNGRENRFVNVTENDLPGCAGLLEKYSNVYLLIKKEDFYEKVKVTNCTSFEE